MASIGQALCCFPLFAVWIARRQRTLGVKHDTSLPIAYFLLLTGGFIGLHRFYLKSILGLIFIPLFLTALYGNVEVRTALDGVSAARSNEMIAEFDQERAEKAVEQSKTGAEQILNEARAAYENAREEFKVARDNLAGWRQFSGSIAAIIAVLIFIDAFRLPALTRRCTHKERPRQPPDYDASYLSFEPQEKEEPTRGIHSRVTDVIDKMNGFLGEFVSYWSLIAVFVYYYEVLARYVFNSPTNWAHESMFLMFGMQYLLAGAYALREGAHVRVDVIYSLLSDRAKALTDVVTSVFFFIFTSTLLGTGWIFFNDAFYASEVSFTEWGIQYWPVKFAIPLGALLILVQGLARLAKDILVLTGSER